MMTKLLILLTFFLLSLAHGADTQIAAEIVPFYRVATKVEGHFVEKTVGVICTRVEKNQAVEECLGHSVVTMTKEDDKLIATDIFDRFELSGDDLSLLLKELASVHGEKFNADGWFVLSNDFRSKGKNSLLKKVVLPAFYALDVGRIFVWVLPSNIYQKALGEIELYHIKKHLRSVMREFSSRPMSTSIYFKRLNRKLVNWIKTNKLSS